MKVKNLIESALYHVRDIDEKWRFSHLNLKGVPVWYPEDSYDFDDSFVDYEWENKVFRIAKKPEETEETSGLSHEHIFHKATERLKELM